MFPESLPTTSCVSGTRGCGRSTAKDIPSVLTPIPETFFEEVSQGATDHYLLCLCDKAASIVWFMTSTDDAKNVSDYLRTSDSPSTPRTFSLSELAEAPFNVYVYVQERGDLVVLPPRRYLSVASRNWITNPRKQLPPAKVPRRYQRKYDVVSNDTSRFGVLGVPR